MPFSCSIVFKMILNTQSTGKHFYQRLPGTAKFREVPLPALAECNHQSRVSVPEFRAAPHNIGFWIADLSRLAEPGWAAGGGRRMKQLGYRPISEQRPAREPRTNHPEAGCYLVLPLTVLQRK